jgi:hypothetical protein
MSKSLEHCSSDLPLCWTALPLPWQPGQYVLGSTEVPDELRIFFYAKPSFFVLLTPLARPLHFLTTGFARPAYTGDPGKPARIPGLVVSEAIRV